MRNDERGRMQLRGGIQIIFHRLEILFFADQRRGENKKSRIHRWDKHTGKEYSNILFSFLFKDFLVWYLREIIEEIIRYTRRRYLKDCSTLCSSITGSRDFNNGELRLVEYQYWYPPSPSLTQNSTLITTGSWNCYIDDLLRHKISTLTALKSWRIVAERKKKIFSALDSNSSIVLHVKSMVLWRDRENDWL